MSLAIQYNLLLLSFIYSPTFVKLCIFFGTRKQGFTANDGLQTFANQNLPQEKKLRNANIISQAR